MEMTINPIHEKFHSLAPYLFYGNDPVNAFDSDGKECKNLNEN